MNNQTIAIVSTFQRLKESLKPHVNPHHGEPKLGLVNYVDYDVEHIVENVHLSEYFFKRKSFEHEAELRAVIQEFPLKQIPGSSSSHYDTNVQPLSGKSLSIDLMKLIKIVRVAPSAPDWFYYLVKNIVKKYDLVCDVHRSRLDDKPVY